MLNLIESRIVRIIGVALAIFSVLVATVAVFAGIDGVELKPTSENWNYTPSFYIVNNRDHSVTVDYRVDCWDESVCQDSSGSVTLSANEQSGAIGAGNVCGYWQLDIKWNGQETGAIVEPQNCPEPPTSTPEPTNTPEPPTGTPEPPSTPDPSPTPEPTNTPVAPRNDVVIESAPRTWWACDDKDASEDFLAANCAPIPAGAEIVVAEVVETPAPVCESCEGLPQMKEVLTAYGQSGQYGMTAVVYPSTGDPLMLIVLTEPFVVHFGYGPNEILQPEVNTNSTGTFYVYLGEWDYDRYYLTVGAENRLENMITLHRKGVASYQPCVLTPDDTHAWQWDEGAFKLFPGQAPVEVEQHFAASAQMVVSAQAADATVAQLFNDYRNRTSVQVAYSIPGDNATVDAGETVTAQISAPAAAESVSIAFVLPLALMVGVGGFAINRRRNGSSS
ncbi:hypothetical protein C4564_03610 [Candidatus Microgenomates bacterium]|nr:MAG: hypothetical protein C4564_03610 [Candidatus Microgenomates bacterium]